MLDTITLELDERDFWDLYKLVLEKIMDGYRHGIILSEYLRLRDTLEKAFPSEWLAPSSEWLTPQGNKQQADSFYPKKKGGDTRWLEQLTKQFYQQMEPIS